MIARTVAAPAVDLCTMLSGLSAAESVANLTPHNPSSDTTRALPRFTVVTPRRDVTLSNGVPTWMPSEVLGPGCVTNIVRSVSFVNASVTVSLPIPRTTIIAVLSRPSRALTTYTNDITGLRHSPTRNGPTAPWRIIA